MTTATTDIVDELRAAVAAIEPGRRQLTSPLTFEGRSGMRVLLWAVVLVLVVVAMMVDSEQRRIAAVLGLVVGATIVFTEAVARRAGYVRIEDGRTEWRLYRTVNRARRVARVLVVNLKYRSRSGIVTIPATLLFDDAGEFILRMTHGMYTDEQIAKLAIHIGTTPVVFPTAVTDNELNRAWPGSASWFLTHIWLVAIAFIAIVVALYALMRYAVA